MTNLERYKADLAKLLKLGELMSLDINLQSLAKTGKLPTEHKETAQKLSGTFEREYQGWYSESLAVVRQLLPARLSEFESLYKSDGRRKQIRADTFTIQDWLLGLRATAHQYGGEKAFDDCAAVAQRFATQVGILQTVERRFESSLFDIRQLAQADLYDSEIDGAWELLKTGFLRPAGVVAGVEAPSGGLHQPWRPA